MSSSQRAAVLMCVVSLWSMSLSAESYSDADLLRNGLNAWNNNECVRAARFLFAYQLREPPELRANEQYRQQISTMITWCEQNAGLAAGTDAKFDRPGQPATTGPQKPNITLPPLAAPKDLNARRCDIYAAVAVAQNEANQRNACAFSGGRWSSEFANHYSWCLNVTRPNSAAETSARQELLDKCVTPVGAPRGGVVSPVSPPILNTPR
jgi:hypothetical protein